MTHGLFLASGFEAGVRILALETVENECAMDQEEAGKRSIYLPVMRHTEVASEPPSGGSSRVHAGST